MDACQAGHAPGTVNISRNRARGRRVDVVDGEGPLSDNGQNGYEITEFAAED
jgi:hypothetical protein